MSVELEAVERAGGAAFTRVGNCELPARFTDPRSEWTAVRQRCGVLDARFRALLRLVGADRATFLQGMLTNDVATLLEGQGTYAALLTQQGKVVSDLRVYALTDEIWLDVPATRAEAVRAALERFIIADDVEFVADEAWAPLVAIEGPHAARVVVAVTGTAVDGLAPFGHRAVQVNGTAARVVAVSHTGERGYLLLGDPQAAPTLWRHCQAAGAEPVGMETLDILRVEAGIPWHGRDMDESTLIMEVGIDAAISFKKGCYLGQEVVERVAARGQVQRKLVGMVCDGPTVPPAESKLSLDAKEMGWTTSAVWSPARDAVVALGYVRREGWEPGSALQVALPNGTTTARVTTLPFYTPPA